MNNADIKAFFDEKASHWDEYNSRDEKTIATILDCIGVSKDDSILDVGCGTGVLIQDYLDRGAEAIVGVDLSPKMIEIAKSKFSDFRVMFVNDDITDIGGGFKFDHAIAYNCFPHFTEPELAIRKMAGCVRPGGTVSVAHGKSRQKINECHNGLTAKYAADLIPAGELAQIFAGSGIKVRYIIDEDYYLVSGTIE